MASLSASPAGASLSVTAAISFSSSAPLRASLASLSFNSRLMRWAVFLPMPGARDSAATSPVRIASRRLDRGILPRICSALRAPIPEIAISRRNISRSSVCRKPYSSIASSRTFRWVYRRHLSPAAGREDKVFMLHISR